MPWFFEGTISDIWQVAADWVPKPRRLDRMDFDFEPQNMRHDQVPRKAVFASKRKQLPDVVIVNAWPLISQRLCEKIESLEPGRHQFFPVEISRASGIEVLGPDGEPHRPADQPYYLYNITDRIDAVDLERCDVDDSFKTLPGSEISPGIFIGTIFMDRVAFKPELIAGRHFWEGIKHIPGKQFMSDELANWIITNKMKGLWLTPTKWFGDGPAPMRYQR